MLVDPEVKSADWFGQLMDKILEECKSVRKEGQKEYAKTEDNVFANFERLSREEFNGRISPEEVLWVYAMKHKDGIASWIGGHRSQREDVRGRIKDLIVYLTLLWGMIEAGGK